MKEIPLTKGAVAIVDDEDFESISRHKWNLQSKGYAARTVIIDGRKVQIFMHRVLTGAPEGFEVDHWDHNTLNNTRDNLRVCTHQQNHGNRLRPRLNRPVTSQYKGVHWESDRGKWKVILGGNVPKRFVGRFDTEIEAARAYDRAIQQIYGEFASLNAA